MYLQRKKCKLKIVLSINNYLRKIIKYLMLILRKKINGEV